MERVLGDEDARGGRVGADHARVPAALGRGMVVEDGDARRALEHGLGVAQAGGLGEVDAEEEVGVLVVVHGAHQAVGAGQELVDARDLVVVGEQRRHVLPGPAALDHLDEGQLGAEGVTVRGGVGAHRDGPRALHEARDLVEAGGLDGHDRLFAQHASPYPSSFSAAPGSTG